MVPEKYKWLENIGELPPLVSAGIQYLGITEVQGKGSNPAIMNMAKTIGVDNIYTDDDTSWCAVFVNFLCNITGLPVVNPKGDKYNLLRAKWLLNWGDEVPVAEMKLGDVGVLNREGGGHVFIIIGKTPQGNVIGLGGNQGNSVSFSEFDSKRLLGVRRDNKTPLVASAKLYTVSGEGQLSTNEA